MTDRPVRYRITVHQLHHGKSTKLVDEYANAFITAATTLIQDNADEIAEVRLHDSGPHLRGWTAQAIADQYPPSKQRR